MSEKSPEQHRDFNQLRAVAERRVQTPSADTLEMSPDEVARLVYELEIHREELEIQNEELRRAHLELKDSRDRFIDLYDFAPVGYLTLNAKGEISEVNLTACEMLGRERARLIGITLALLFDLESRPELQTHFDEVLATGDRRVAELQLAIDGKVDIQLETCRTKGTGDDEYHCRTVMTDITARKQAERSAREHHRHLRSLTDALPVLIGYLDIQQRIQFSNAAYQEWFGSSADDLHGQSLPTLFADSKRELEDYFQDALEGRRVDFESHLTHQQLGERHVQIMFMPDVAPDGQIQGIHSLCIDITDRKLVEQQMTRRRHFVERLVRLNGAEKQVYDLLVRGKSSKAVSLELDIGLRTAERRRQSVMEKLEVESVAELLQHLSDIQNVDQF